MVKRQTLEYTRQFFYCSKYDSQYDPLLSLSLFALIQLKTSVLWIMTGLWFWAKTISRLCFCWIERRHQKTHFPIWIILAAPLDGAVICDEFPAKYILGLIILRKCLRFHCYFSTGLPIKFVLRQIYIIYLCMHVYVYVFLGNAQYTGEIWTIFLIKTPIAVKLLCEMFSTGW